MRTKNLSVTLTDCIVASLDATKRDFHWEGFFKLWFRTHGTPYYILFHKHLGVTNTQYVELFSLVEKYCACITGSSQQHLLFHTTEQVKSILVDSINMLLDTPAETFRARAQEFADTYVDVLAATVAVDMFYCSCAIFLPPGATLDLLKVCSDAGYIYAAGRSIFVRNIKKSRAQDLHDALKLHLENSPPANYPIPFVVYGRKDFDKDKPDQEEIGQGIEHVKLHFEKMSMGAYRLPQVVNALAAAFEKELYVPPAGEYQEVHDFSAYVNRTIWLVCDRSTSSIQQTSPGRERYYICYEQIYKTANPFYLFDENKPGWKSHTTLPHSLTAALINITNQHPGGMDLCDPFGGSGTTWLEAKRLKLKGSVRCSDKSPITPLLARDNLLFFTLQKEALQTLQEWLLEADKIVGTVSAPSPPPDPDPQQTLFPVIAQAKKEPEQKVAYLAARQLLGQIRARQPEEDQEFTFDDRDVTRLSSWTFKWRFIFYIVLRAELRFQGDYSRKAITPEKAFRESLKKITDQIKKFVDIYNRIQDKPPCRHNSVIIRGDYSEELVPCLVASNDPSIQRDLSEVQERDALDIVPESLDVIICDPPYGFNTTEQPGGLAALYANFIERALASLRDGGHLIICLPAESYTGRELVYCTKSGLVTNQVLVKARALGKQVYVQARSFPSSFFSPPYYWESERALTRHVLHFRVAGRKAAQPTVQADGPASGGSAA